MNKDNLKKNNQLKMSYGKANNILKKDIMFYLAKKLKMDACFRCKKKIKLIEEFSIDHKVDWLDSDNPRELFFNIENIAFSHLSCNIQNGKRKKGIRDSTKHGLTMYKHGCRCSTCVIAMHKQNCSSNRKKYNRQYQKKRYKNEKDFREKNIEKSKKYYHDKYL